MKHIMIITMWYFLKCFYILNNNDVETVSLPTERKENEWFLENHVFRRIHWIFLHLLYKTQPIFRIYQEVKLFSCKLQYMQPARPRGANPHDSRNILLHSVSRSHHRFNLGVKRRLPQDFCTRLRFFSTLLQVLLRCENRWKGSQSYPCSNQ